MMASQQTYVYANANVDRPDGQGGSDALHALAVNERNFLGPTVSPMPDDGLTGFERFMMTLDLPDLNNAFVNFSGGLGDVALMGLGSWGRESLGIGSVDTTTGSYKWGGRTGTVAMLATGAGGLLRTAGAKIVGTAQSTGTWGSCCCIQSDRIRARLRPASREGYTRSRLSQAVRGYP
jgi:hypothetical protein